MKLAIYGAGQYGDIFYKSLLQNDVAIDFFIDEYTNKKTLHGKPIYKLKDAPQAKVYNSVATYEEKVLNNLNKHAFQHVTFEETLRAFPNIIKEFAKEKYLWLRDDTELLNEKLNQVRPLLKDTKSIEIFNKLVNFRKTFDVDDYPLPNATLAKQYLCQDIPILKSLESIKFIDCGAFTGDTVKSLMQEIGEKVDITVSFELDSNNLEKLTKEVQQQTSIYPNSKFLVYPMGVYSKNSILKFSSNSAGSSLCEKGDIEVPVCSLDQTVFGIQPNYIKMDIEGAEKEAILGAQNIITTYKPNLAISLYHKPEDLWELPLLIHKLNPNYHMYLRVHNHMAIETILYCIDESNLCID